MFSYLSLENFSCFAKFELHSITKINIFIGANDTGKTHLIKLLYTITKSIEEFTKRTESDQPDWREVLAEKLFWVYQPESNKLGQLVKKGESRLKVETRLLDESYYFAFGKDTARQITDCTELAPTQPGLNALFIPPKEVLTALDAIATINEQLQIFGFDHTYYDLIKALRVPPTKGNIQENLKAVLTSLEHLLTGEIVKEQDQFIFKRGREKYGMSQIAEGFKKLGILTTLIRNRSLNQSTILFIDEPEANLHPQAIHSLVDMLFLLSQAGITIYASTHSYSVIKKLEILARKHQESIQLCSLTKSNGDITAQVSDLSEGMPDNPIIDAAIELYEEDVRLELEP